MNHNPQENPLALRARRLADHLLAGLDHGGSVLVATADGFDLAFAGSRPVDRARLAAMVSSLAALGDAAGRETGIGSTRCLVLDALGGRLVVRCLSLEGHPLTVAVLTDTSVLLGLVWNQLARVEAMADAT